MNMTSARRLAAKHLNVGISRVKIDSTKLKEIKDAITGEDIKGMSKEGVFKKVGQGQSRARARKLLLKKRAGRKRGPGKRKGSKNSRENSKALWLRKVRSQRTYIKKLLAENRVDSKGYRDLYRKIKGGFFRTKSHIDIYLSKN